MAKARVYVCGYPDDFGDILADLFGTIGHRSAKPAQPKREQAVSQPAPAAPLDMKDPHMRAAYLLGELDGGFAPPKHDPKLVVHRELVAPEVLRVWQKESAGDKPYGESVRAYIQELARHNGMARYVPFDRAAQTFFRDLVRLMPNMAHVLRWLARYLRYY